MKKFAFLIKKLYYSKILDKSLSFNAPSLYNEIDDFRENFGIKYSKYCKMKNELEIKFSDNLKNDIDKEKNTLDNNAKNAFIRFYKGYENYLEKYIKIK